MFGKLISLFSRFLFLFALLLLLLAVLDRIIRLFGWTFSWIPYEPSRLLEIAATLIVFVLALLLRQIRDNTRPGA